MTLPSFPAPPQEVDVGLPPLRLGLPELLQHPLPLQERIRPRVGVVLDSAALVFYAGQQLGQIEGDAAGLQFSLDAGGEGARSMVMPRWSEGATSVIRTSGGGIERDVSVSIGVESVAA
jgi:hypothetical protein